MRAPPRSAAPGGHGVTVVLESPPVPTWQPRKRAKSTAHSFPLASPPRASRASLSSTQWGFYPTAPRPLVPPAGPPRVLAASWPGAASRSSPGVLARAHAHARAQAVWAAHCPPPCRRSESVIVNNFFSSVDGQLELLGQATLDSPVSSMGALHALRPRLSHFHQLLFEPLEVGWAAWGWAGRPGGLAGWPGEWAGRPGGGRGGCSLAPGSSGPEWSRLCVCSWSHCTRRGASWPRLWATRGCTWSSCWPAP